MILDVVSGRDHKMTSLCIRSINKFFNAQWNVTILGFVKYASNFYRFTSLIYCITSKYKETILTQDSFFPVMKDATRMIVRIQPFNICYVLKVEGGLSLCSDYRMGSTGPLFCSTDNNPP